MKIGFSLGQCIRDIEKGLVHIDDVVMIIAGTLIRSNEELLHVIHDYTFRDNYLADCDEEMCIIIANELWADQKVIQPRMAKVYNSFRPFNSIWCDIAPSYSTKNIAVKNAWDAYRTVAVLAGEKI